MIISWSDREGRGVIQRAEGPDVEFSFTAVHQASGSYLGLTVGLRVTFVLVNTDSGVQAQDVVVGWA
ncbi:cold shock domain-containing protein [Actinomadura rubrisoli]|uniref:cold shock domain-containing protein n=1 Tax=Actinomadura rubrisoli TaxID=2530368 RepID=UPI001404EC44|nr:cold shock domain-containing protein [Actinomadura rubrisoli]